MLHAFSTSQQRQYMPAKQDVRVPPAPSSRLNQVSKFSPSRESCLVNATSRNTMYKTVHPPVQGGERVSRLVRCDQSNVKVSRILDIIRGRPYYDAVGILTLVQYKHCSTILEKLKEAAEEAVNKYGMSKQKMYVCQASISKGPTVKGVEFRAQGRVNVISHRSSKAFVAVRERSDIEESGLRISEVEAVDDEQREAIADAVDASSKDDDEEL